jgi:doublesex- and mab-3-related transcription factor 4/5
MDKERNGPPPGASRSTASTSEATASSSEATGGSYPTCARCRNHWLKIRVKGHKRFCRYRDCTCDKCYLVAKSQKYTAFQTSVWRAQAQDEAHLAQQASQEGVTVSRRVPLELDSRLKARIRNFLESASGRKRVRAPSAQGTDSRLVESSNNSLSSGDRTLSAALANGSSSLNERSVPRHSSHTSTSDATQTAASDASRTDPRVMEGSGSSLYTRGRTPLTTRATDSRANESSSYSLSAGCRTLSTAPATDPRSLDERTDPRYSSRCSTGGTTQPAALEWSGYSLCTGGRTMPTAPVATFPTAPAVPAMDSRATESSDYSLSTRNRTLLAAPVASAAPDTDSRTVDGGCYPFSAGGRTLPTAPVTGFLSLDGARKALYPSLSSATGRILPIAPIATLPTSSIASAAPAADFRPIKSSDYSLSTGDRTLLTAPVTSAAPDTDSRTVDGGGYPLSAGGRTLSTAPVTDFLSLDGTRKALYPLYSSATGRVLPIAPIATLPTAPIVSTAPAADFRAIKSSVYSLSTGNVTLLTVPVTSAAPDTDSRTLDGDGFPLTAGSRTLPTAPVTNFLSVEGAHKALYPSLSSTSGKTLPIVPIATLPTVPVASTVPISSVASAVDSLLLEGSSYSLHADGRTLPTALFGFAAPWMDSSPMEGGRYALPTGGRSLHTAFSVKAYPSQFPLWCGQEFPNRGLVSSAYNEMLNQYYQNLSYLTEPH